MSQTPDATAADRHAGHNNERIAESFDAEFPPYDWRVQQERRPLLERLLRRSPKPAEVPERVGSVELWYPHARRTIAMPVRGAYANNYPIGAVVHTTEGHAKRGDQNAEDTMQDGARRGFCYFCISWTGRIYQPAPLNLWGYHCDPTYHPVMGRSLGSKLVGIELCNGGLMVLTASGWKPVDFADIPWSETYTDAELRQTDKVFNVTRAGTYHCMTAAQEEALTQLLIWMHRNNPAVFKVENVVGHDEVAVDSGTTTLGRKSDPGASLSLYMPAYREKLAQLLLTS
jgi:N-acetylmuramoyl-L-alanine amidase